MYWKKLSSEYIYQAQWLTVRKDKVELPKGPVLHSYYVLEYPDWVNVIGLTKEGDFVLVRQYRHGLEQVSFELCAGICDATDASPLETAKREMLEETGYGGGQWQEWMVVSANPGTHSNLTYCYLATGLERMEKPQLEETEELTVHLFSPDEVKELLKNGDIVQALHAAPLWKYFAICS